MSKTFSYGKNEIGIKLTNTSKARQFYKDLITFYDVEEFKNKLMEIADYYDSIYGIIYDQKSNNSGFEYIVVFMDKSNYNHELGEFEFEIKYLNDDKILNYLEY